MGGLIRYRPTAETFSVYLSFTELSKHLRAIGRVVASRVQRFDIYDEDTASAMMYSVLGDRTVRRKIIVFAVVGLVVVFFATSVTYVHEGYVGVVESGTTLRLLDRGAHLKPPAARVTFYPVRSREIHLQTCDEGVLGKVEFDLVLLVSVSPDSIESLHRAYGGAYVERLISPRIVEFLRARGEASEAWAHGTGSDKEADKILQHLDSTATSHGINIMRGRIRSYDVVTK